MWRRLSGSRPRTNDAGDGMDDGAIVPHCAEQSNQVDQAGDPRLSAAWQAAEYAKSYIDERVNYVAFESRTSAEALAHAVNQVHEDQEVLKANLGAVFRSIETTALDHVRSVSHDLLTHHYEALNAFDRQLEDFNRLSLTRDDQMAAAFGDHEISIVTSQRALNTRMDDLEAMSKSQAESTRRYVDDLCPDSLVNQVSKLDEVTDGLSHRVFQLQDDIGELPSRVAKLEETVHQLPQRVCLLEERVEVLRSNERRIHERVDNLTAASKNEIDSVATRMSLRINQAESRSTRASLEPLESTKKELVQKIDDVAVGAKVMLDETEARLVSRAVPRDSFIQTAALAASLHDKVNDHAIGLSQLRSAMESSMPAFSAHYDGQARELVTLTFAQEQQAQTIQALRLAFDRQSVQISNQAREIASIHATQTQQEQELRELSEAQGRQRVSVQVNSAATNHASQAFEALRLWVEATASQQERHCRAIRETCADLEQSLDERLEAWLLRESEILAVRDRAASIASDCTDSNLESASESGEGGDESLLYPPEIPASSRPRRDQPLRPRDQMLTTEIQVRAARLVSDRIQAAAVQQHRHRIVLERQVREDALALAAERRRSATQARQQDCTASTETQGAQTDERRFAQAMVEETRIAEAAREAAARLEFERYQTERAERQAAQQTGQEQSHRDAQQRVEREQADRRPRSTDSNSQSRGRRQSSESGIGAARRRASRGQVSGRGQRGGLRGGRGGGREQIGQPRGGGRELIGQPSLLDQARAAAQERVQQQAEHRASVLRANGATH